MSRASSLWSLIAVSGLCLGVVGVEAAPITVVSPGAGSVWVPGGAVPVLAAVEGAATHPIEYLVDDESIGQAEEGVAVQWMAEPPGVHEVVARLWSSDIAYVDSDPVEVVVGAPLRSCVLVVGNVTLPVGDEAIAARLRWWGYEVDVLAAAAANASSANGYDLVFISESVSSSDVSTKFRDTAAPVICGEDYNFDEMKMTGPTVNTDYGFIWDQTQVVVSDASSPLAGGLAEGTVTIFSSLGRLQWGIPNGNATVAAHVLGAETEAVTFGYEAGAEMVGLEAPGKRCGFFLQAYTQEMTLLTSDGLALFDAAVRWTGGAAAVTAPNAPADLASGTNGSIRTFSWTDNADNEEGFVLEQSSDGVVYTLLARTAADTVSINELVGTGVAERYLRVRAWNAAGYSGYSNVVTIGDDLQPVDVWAVK